MKPVLCSVLAILLFQVANGQITITSADMPVVGDTLRYSFASPVGSTINPADSGANFTWNYSLSPISQAVDTYQLAASVNPLYALVGITAAGYKVADSFPIPGGFLPISIKEIYTFFLVKSSPSRYETKAFAAKISGVPTPINYTEPDVWYRFPLNYGNLDSAHYKLNIALPTLASLKEIGVRTNYVDGWGTITTPYYTTPVSCVRVRSVIHEIDSVSVAGLPLALGIPRNTVEYKWLVNGDHYPALWVTSQLLPGGGETVTNIRYRDVWRDTSIAAHVSSVPSIVALKASPVPAVNGKVSLELPAAWTDFVVEVFDMQSNEVALFKNTKLIDLSSVPTGTYIVRVISGQQTGYVKIVK